MNFPLNYSKVCLNNTLYIQGNSKEFNIHHGIFIDVFPIDNINIRLLPLQLLVIRALTGAREYKINKKYKKNYEVFSTSKIKSIVCSGLALLPMDWLISLLDMTMTVLNNKKTKYMYELCTSSKVLKPLRSEVYEELMDMEFCKKTFLASRHYNEFLNARFENINSMAPFEKRVPSHNIIKCKL